MHICNSKRAVWLLWIAIACLVTGSVWAAEEDPDDALVQMIVDLLSDSDRDMRALGLQQVREEVPGAAATEKFAALLPQLPPDGQASLLDALGDRGDAAARPAVLEMLKSEQVAVRAAAIRALGGLGNASDVPALAERAAGGEDVEKGAARQSLVRLRGDDTNAAIVSAMAEGSAEVRVELLGVLAARNAKEALPTVLESVKDSESSVRLAALGALRFLADETHTPAIVEALKAAKDPLERRNAELALLVVGSRTGQASAEAIVAGLADADVPSRIALLRALARAGGEKALEAVVAGLEDEDQAVRDEAVRMLSGWSDPAAAPPLLQIVASTDNLRHHVVAIRGLVRMAGPKKDTPADLKTLTKVMAAAKRPQEKRLVLGTLGGVDSEDALGLAALSLSDPALVEEAGLAVVMIAEKIKDGDQQKIRAALQDVLNQVKTEQVRQRAQKLLQSRN